MSAPFQTVRPDGRSHVDVLFALIDEDLTPGTVFTHGQLQNALSLGLPSPFPRERVYGVVGGVRRRLEAQRQRTLGPVRGVGYRVLTAEEHAGEFGVKRHRLRRSAIRLVRFGKSVRADELNPEQRDKWVRDMVGASEYETAILSADQRHKGTDELVSLLKRGELTK